ncbi:MAG TPA: amidophosphoribosyltransferase [Elusimicrobia bacterium]|jgi:amidophosphoribosyltransferase|nr:amidophosphoribosyltransferase [Elusimicrobiota bacterium]
MCGIFGVYNHPEATRLTYLGLYALQHRGQESAGIVSSDGEKLYPYLGVGLVADVFSQEVLDKLHGNLAIGHTRYSTAGADTKRDMQPILVEYRQDVGDLAVAHNGNLLNADNLRRELIRRGCNFQTTADTEIIPQLLACGWTNSLEHDLPWTLRQIKGAYSLLFMTRKELIAARDPYGVRPLCMGEIDGGYVFASESSAFDLIGAKYIREIEPGEIVIVNAQGIKSIFFDGKLHTKMVRGKHAFCIFEYIYFSRPDSRILDRNVHLVRKNLGYELFKENKIKADIVIPVPDSANSAAVGYAEVSKIPYETGLIRNHYVGRTFIEPKQSIRDFGAKIKYNPVRDIINGKKIVVIDDSIVRGTTSRKLMQMLKNAGAKEIHLCISCPPIKCPCFYGIDTPTEKELIASTHSVKEIRDFIGVDSLHYLSLEGLIRATGLPKEQFCVACFTGDYPIK